MRTSKTIALDTGVEQVRIGEGVLRFHPADPNLFVRFREAGEKLRAVEEEMVQKAEGELSGMDAVELLSQADRQMKQILAWVFGPGNDFDKILGGVNLLAVAANGERVVTNLFAALEPVLADGAQRCAQIQTEQAVAKAKSRRAAQ